MGSLAGPLRMSSNTHEYLPSIGMEVHAELHTRSKMFCRCPVAFGGEPNTRVCPVCLGHPGSLPVPNDEAVRMVLQTALALNCKIASHSVFHRKNYFYPDLPKGYQVSQYGETNPIGYHGWLDVETESGIRRISIQRVHLEEDTGKLMHLPSGGSGVDYNRAGVPLMEIVTGFPPDLHSAEDAREYLVQLRQILLHLGVTDGKMEEGSLRCEPNISVRRADQPGLGTKTELKNLNSFRSVSLGVEFEVRRQIAMLEHGEPVRQETRGWNEATETSFPMRSKENEQDYRYFPDPDLAPMSFSDEVIAAVRANLPELPLAKARRYREELGLGPYDASLLVADPEWARFFEEAVRLGGDPKMVCNWMQSDFARLLNESGQIARVDSMEGGREVSRVRPIHLVELCELVQSGKISGKMAKQLFAEVFETGASPSGLVEARGLEQIESDEDLIPVVDEVLGANAEAVESFKSGKQGVIGFLVGQVMKKTQGRASPQKVQELLRRRMGV